MGRPVSVRFLSTKNLTLQSGERTNTAGRPVSNKILLSIPDHEYSVLRPHLDYISLPSHLTLHGFTSPRKE